MKTQQELAQIRHILLSIPFAEIDYLNENEGRITLAVARLRPDKMNEIKHLVGAKDIYATYAPAMFPKGVIVCFEF